VCCLFRLRSDRLRKKINFVWKTESKCSRNPNPNPNPNTQNLNIMSKHTG